MNENEETTKFEIELPVGGFTVVSEEEYAEGLKYEEEAVGGQLLEYFDAVYMFKTTKDGKTVWIAVY